jgi:hypothetical protein
MNKKPNHLRAIGLSYFLNLQNYLVISFQLPTNDYYQQRLLQQEEPSRLT